MTIRASLGTALLLLLAVGAGLFNWSSSTGQSVAGDVPDSPGVDRQVHGLHVLNAYLLPSASRAAALTVVADLVTSSGGGDRLLTVSAGGGAA